MSTVPTQCASGASLLAHSPPGKKGWPGAMFLPGKLATLNGAVTPPQNPTTSQDPALLPRSLERPHHLWES